MAVCQQCVGGSKKRVLISEQYCEVCGFVFVKEFPGLTCRSPMVQDRGLSQNSPKSDYIEHVDVIDAESVNSDPDNTSKTQEVHQAQTAVAVDSAVAKVFQAIQSHPLIGKSEILRLSGVSEADYTEAKNELLTSGRIVQQGERKGAKYKVV